MRQCRPTVCGIELRLAEHYIAGRWKYFNLWFMVRYSSEIECDALVNSRHLISSGDHAVHLCGHQVSAVTSLPSLACVLSLAIMINEANGAECDISRVLTILENLEMSGNLLVLENSEKRINSGNFSEAVFMKHTTSCNMSLHGCSGTYVNC